MFRRITILIAVLALILSLSGCLYYYYEVDRTYELLYDVSEIEAINIYYVPEEVYYELPDHPVAQVDPEQYEMFALGLRLLEFKEGYLIVFAPIDSDWSFREYTVEIRYINGAYEIICDGYQVYCDTDGKERSREYHIDDRDWEQFVTHYMESSSKLRLYMGPYWFRRG